MLKLNSSPQGYIQDSYRKLLSQRAQVQQAHEITGHRHSRGQLLFARNQSLQIRIGDTCWHLPAQQAVWIPSNQEHQVFAPNGADYLSVYSDESCFKDLPNQAGCVALSRLAKELIMESAQFGEHYQPDSPESRLNQVLFDQLRQLKTDAWPLIMPQYNLLKKLCDRLIENPQQQISLQSWGQQFGATERHLARRFKTETGLTYTQWRHRLEILYMLQAVQKGFSLSYIAADLNYAQVSAFSKMVKRETGFCPSELIQLKQLNG